MSRLRRAGAATVVIAGVVLAACSAPRSELIASWPWRMARRDYLARSAVWVGGDPDRWIGHMRTLDLRHGPPGRGAFVPDALVRCAYVPPPDAATFSGATPEFLCHLDRDDHVFKVKWGADNGEIYAEVAATRLLWALGFPTDRVYPVRVQCTGCADDPWNDPTLHPRHVPPSFEPAVAEWAFDGRTIEEHPHQGWTWGSSRSSTPHVAGHRAPTSTRSGFWRRSSSTATAKPITSDWSARRRASNGPAPGSTAPVR